ncbi:MAG TPA: LLM class flavin-dependent oxidoreductase [Chloroflexota bacterium]|nr:LLM class flavin-dependent oxidoreductase [Chloroflexota bacterium]
MEFGLFSNGFRPHTTASQTYDEDLYEIVLADELGFREVWISEHHGEPVYIDKVDTIPIPELLMAKAAGQTKHIRMGPAVKLIHLYHPVDTAQLCAVTDHLLGGRYMFGFGSGFPQKLFSEERGLSYDDRYPRMLEALELIQKCWTSPEPFDWDGQYWQAKGVTALPKPLQQPMPIAVATTTEDTIKMAGERGYTLLSAGFDAPPNLRRKADWYARAALAAGRSRPLETLTVASFVYVADSVQQAVEDLRPAVTLELGYQKKRGLLRFVLSPFNIQKDIEDITLDDLIELGIYNVGDPETVYNRLKRYYDECGGFGTLLLFAGKDWATREKRSASLRRFMSEVAPRLADLKADREPELATA